MKSNTESKKNKAVILTIIFAICIFFLISCGDGNSEGSVTNGTGQGAGEIQRQTNDTINSNKGSADGGYEDGYDSSSRGIGGAIKEGTSNIKNAVTDMENSITGNDSPGQNNMSSYNSSTDNKTLSK